MVSRKCVIEKVTLGMSPKGLEESVIPRAATGEYYWQRK